MKKEKGWTKIGNLEWSEDLGIMDWFTAEKICKEMGGRLPTKKELLYLFNNHFEEMKKMLKQNPGGYDYWSATTHSTDPEYAWGVGLRYEDTSYGNKTSSISYRVRCVR